MAYDVISFGDGEILTNAFQGVALVFGGTFLNKLIISGFILGIFFICFNYLIRLQFPLFQWLTGIVFYLVMFVPTGTVFVEDLYTGEVRAVANVPIGVAVPASIVSNAGIQTAVLFETAFSTPDQAKLQHAGYLNALSTILKLRAVGMGAAGSSSALIGDLSATLHDYIETCVMLDIEGTALGVPQEVSRESLLKSTDILSDFRVTYWNIDVWVSLPGLEPQQMNCFRAYDAIQNYMTSNAFMTQLDDHMKGVLEITSPDTTAADAIADAMAGIGRVGIDSQVYMRNIVLESVLMEGPSAFITRPAIEQLNLQWGAEQSMFNMMARPLMAFVEMFAVSISPIMAFLTTMGVFGITMMTRYLQLMAWIALWGPLMAVCNLYISIVVSRALDAKENYANVNGTGLDSLVMHDQFYHTIGTWMSTGSMLAASVPTLALMIVYGGSVVASNIAGRMTAGASNTVNPKTLAPEPMSVSAPVSVQPMLDNSYYGGSKKMGMADNYTDIGSTVNHAKQSARDSMISASQSASKTLSEINQYASKSGYSTTQADTVMKGMQHMIDSGTSWTSSDGKQYSNTSKMSDAEREIVNGTVSGYAAGNISSKFLGAGVEANLISQAGTEASRAHELGQLTQHNASRSDASSDRSVSSSGSSHQTTTQNFSGDERMRSLSEAYQHQMQKVVQAQEKYAEMATLQQSFGTSTTLADQDLANRLVRSGALPYIAVEVGKMDAVSPREAVLDRSRRAVESVNSGAGVLRTMSDEREALIGFKKLAMGNPSEAADILKKYIAPSLQDMDNKMSPGDNKIDGLNIDTIVPDETADGYTKRAERAEGLADNNRVRGISGDDYVTGGGEASDVATPRAAHPGNGSTSSSTAGQAHSSPSNTQGSSLKSSVESEIGEPLNPDQATKQIDEGGHLDREKISGTELMYRAGNNHPVINGINNFVDDHGNELEGVKLLKDASESLEHNLINSNNEKLNYRKDHNISEDDMPPIHDNEK